MLPSRTVKAKVVTVFLIRWYTIRYNHSRSIIFSQLNLDAIHTLRTTPPVCSGENRMLWHRHRIQFVWIRSHFIFCFLFFFFLCNSILFRCVRKNLFDFGWFYRNINNTFGKSKEIPLMQSFSSVDMIKCACVYRSQFFFFYFHFVLQVFLYHWNDERPESSEWQIFSSFGIIYRFRTFFCCCCWCLSFVRVFAQKYCHWQNTKYIYFFCFFSWIQLLTEMKLFQRIFAFYFIFLNIDWIRIDKMPTTTVFDDFDHEWHLNYGEFHYMIEYFFCFFCRRCWFLHPIYSFVMRNSFDNKFFFRSSICV